MYYVYRGAEHTTGLYRGVSFHPFSPPRRTVREICSESSKSTRNDRSFLVSSSFSATYIYKYNFLNLVRYMLSGRKKTYCSISFQVFHNNKAEAVLAFPCLLFVKASTKLLPTCATTTFTWLRFLMFFLGDSKTRKVFDRYSHRSSAD